MKKFIAILFALAMIVALSLTAFAATGINEFEQAVLDKLESIHDLGTDDLPFEIPQEYVNTAKNYFAGECEMTEAEKTAILSSIDAGIAVVKKEAETAKIDGKQYDLSSMSATARDEVLALGQSACKEVDLQLTYTPATNKVTISKVTTNPETGVTTTTPVFDSAPVVKTTGQAVTVNAAFVGCVIAVVLAVGTCAMFVVAKKNGLLVK